MKLEPMAAPLTEDSGDAVRVVGTDLLLEVLAVELHCGASVDELVERHPALTREVAHRVAAYVLGHREDVAEYLRGRLRTTGHAAQSKRSLSSYWGWFAAGAILGLEALLVIAGWSMGTTDMARQWAMLSGAFGLCVGIAGGFLASPLDEAEGKQFGSIASLFSAFISGFLVSKADRLFDSAAEQGLLLRSTFLVPMFVFVGSGLLAALFVWLWRSYNFS